MLIINNLHASSSSEEILRGVTLSVPAGEVHALMGPNGSGKSTLANVLAGNPDYKATSGRVEFRGQDLLAMKPFERARAGLFLIFQNPIAIPGVTLSQLIHRSYNEIATIRGEAPLGYRECRQLLEKEAEALSIPVLFIDREVHQDLSAGEKKKAELLQALIIKPEFVIFDEIDSGLDVDALKVVSNTINRLRCPERSLLIITHYARILEYVVPDKVHILEGGVITRSGDASLAREIDREGYTLVSS